MHSVDRPLVIAKHIFPLYLRYVVAFCRAGRWGGQQWMQQHMLHPEQTQSHICRNGYMQRSTHWKGKRAISLNAVARVTNLCVCMYTCCWLTLSQIPGKDGEPGWPGSRFHWRACPWNSWHHTQMHCWPAVQNTNQTLKQMTYNWTTPHSSLQPSAPFVSSPTYLLRKLPVQIFSEKAVFPRKFQLNLLQMDF